MATMIIAILVGYPFSRLRTIYFFMINLLFGIGMLSVNSIFEKYTGGHSGLKGIPPYLPARRHNAAISSQVWR
ncbi:MAG: hypothetical protein ABSH25_07165 [Syntrophorhabdales bacterium]